MEVLARAVRTSRLSTSHKRHLQETNKEMLLNKTSNLRKKQPVMMVGCKKKRTLRRNVLMLCRICKEEKKESERMEEI